MQRRSFFKLAGTAALGEAAGKVAATAAKTNRQPQDVKLEEAG